MARCNELLERPTTREPSALGKSLLEIVLGNVRKERVTDGSFAVPGEHGVDGFGELGAARLVDTARVDPDVAESMSARNGTRIPYFVGKVGVV